MIIQGVVSCTCGDNKAARDELEIVFGRFCFLGEIVSMGITHKVGRCDGEQAMNRDGQGTYICYWSVFCWLYLAIPLYTETATLLSATVLNFQTFKFSISHGLRYCIRSCVQSNTITSYRVSWCLSSFRVPIFRVQDVGAWPWSSMLPLDYFSLFFFFQQTKVKNRGVNEIWTDAVMRAAEAAAKGTAPKAISGHLVRMGDLGNVPRQEKKFKVQ